MIHAESTTIVRGSLGARGSSLIELLVSILIIVVLLSVLVPSLRRSMQIAASTVCMSNLRAVGSALEMYRIENNGSLPSFDLNEAQTNGSDGVWFIKLFPKYLNDQLALSCPEDPQRIKRVDANNANGGTTPLSSSYGINGFVMTYSGGLLADFDRRQPSRPLDTILAADVGPDMPPPSNNVDDDDEDVSAREMGFLSWGDGYDPLEAEVTDPWVTTRHGTSINMLSIGGAIREVQTRQVLTNPIQPFYSQCAAGGCSLCNELQIPHYSFYRDRLYWWTGPLPQE